MVRHISMFTMEENPSNGRTVEENETVLKEYLSKIPEQEPSIIGCRVYKTVSPALTMYDDSSVAFAQVVQALDFKNAEAAAAYPATPAHAALQAFSEGIVKKVTTIDFEI